MNAKFIILLASLLSGCASISEKMVAEYRPLIDRDNAALIRAEQQAAEVCQKAERPIYCTAAWMVEHWAPTALAPDAAAIHANHIVEAGKVAKNTDEFLYLVSQSRMDYRSNRDQIIRQKIARAQALEDRQYAAAAMVMYSGGMQISQSYNNMAVAQTLANPTVTWNGPRY
jgi:hypothetical protein